MRLYRISFVAGFAAGFVIGTRAGREKYDQMVKMAKAAAENPAVQQAAGTIQAQASSLASTAAQKVGSQLHDKVPPFAHTAAQTVAEHIQGLVHRNSAAEDQAMATNGHPYSPTGNGQGKQGGTSSS
jgi:type IV secretory pathway TrbL component